MVRTFTSLKTGALCISARFTDLGWEWARSLWTRLKPKVEAKPAAIEAAQDVARAPADESLWVT